MSGRTCTSGADQTSRLTCQGWYRRLKGAGDLSQRVRESAVVRGVEDRAHRVMGEQPGVRDAASLEVRDAPQRVDQRADGVLGVEHRGVVESQLRSHLALALVCRLENPDQESRDRPADGLATKLASAQC